MLAKIIIKNLDEAEAAAKKILEHVEAIRELQRSMSWTSVAVQVELNSKNEAVSGN